MKGNFDHLELLSSKKHGFSTVYLLSNWLTTFYDACVYAQRATSPVFPKSAPKKFYRRKYYHFRHKNHSSGLEMPLTSCATPLKTPLFVLWVDHLKFTFIVTDIVRENVFDFPLIRTIGCLRLLSVSSKKRHQAQFEFNNQPYLHEPT